MNPPIWFWLLAAFVISAFFGGWAIYKKTNGLQVEVMPQVPAN
jgi:hypothetical protein